MACLFFEEDFRETEAAAREFLRIVVANKCHTFLTDFGEIDFPGKLGEQFGIELGARRLVLMLRLRCDGPGSC